MSNINVDFISRKSPEIQEMRNYELSIKETGKQEGTLSIKTETSNYQFRWKYENNSLRIISFSSIIREYYVVWNIDDIGSGLKNLGNMIAQDIIQEYETIFQKLRECYSGRVEKIMIFLEKNKEPVNILSSPIEFSPLEQALAQIGATFGRREVDESITEVSSLLPDTLDITLGELNISKTYPEREISVNGFRFRIWQQTTNNGNFGGQIAVCKIQPIFERNTPFLLPDELEVIDDTKNMLNNRAGVNSPISNKEGIFIGNADDIGNWLQEIFFEYKKLALGHTFVSLAENIGLRRNYGFLVWLILHYNKSFQK